MEAIKQKLLQWFKTPLAIFVAIGVLIAGYIEFLRVKNRNLEANAETAESKAKDQVLAQQQTDLKAQNAAAIADLEKEKGRSLTDSELNDFLNKL
jgi:uncharacterized protein HemX